MPICSMCRKEVDKIIEDNNLPLNRKICQECSEKINQLLTSEDVETVKKAVNYIYTCANQTTDEDLSACLNTMLDDNASVIDELKQTKSAKEKAAIPNAPVVFGNQTDYYSDKTKKESQAQQKTGFGPAFMWGIAWFLWIGGFILAIITSIEQTGRYASDTSFNWLNFFMLCMIYFVAGGFALCMSELLLNVAIIKNELLKRKKK